MAKRSSDIAPCSIYIFADRLLTTAYLSAAFSAWPVNDFFTFATSSGVPVATTLPPPEPPSEANS